MPPLGDPTILRIIDASLNRAAEGLRVVEDICRFGWELPGLSREFKELRHSLLRAFAPEPARRAALAAARDIEEDVGRDHHVPAAGTDDIFATAIRNIERAKEALRSLEEVGRIEAPTAAAEAAALRYRLYSVEKAVLAMASSRTARRAGGELAEGSASGSTSGSAGRPGPMESVRLYLIATARLCAFPIIDAVRAALAGGADAVQMREKGLADRKFLSSGRTLREITARAGVPFIVNDRPDIALLLGADGLHLGQDDLPVAQARRILGNEALIGVSTHSPDEARRAAREGASYAGAGPSFSTETKTVGPPLGPEGIRAILDSADIPIFPIGGIRTENVRLLTAAGARRAAVSSGILGAASLSEIERAARAIRQALDGASISKDL